MLYLKSSDHHRAVCSMSQISTYIRVLKSIAIQNMSKSMENRNGVTWEVTEVKSPRTSSPVQVIAAKNIPYFPNANRLQNLNIYLLKNAQMESLIGSEVTRLPISTDNKTTKPHILVHIHGGAWRDPNLQATSIEAAVAHIFSPTLNHHPITIIASLNYTISPFPKHPTEPYDPANGDHSDPAREAVHPQHIQDVLAGFKLLRDLGLTEDDSYILSGHSAGACLSAQAVLLPSTYWKSSLPSPPRPAAFLGMNGLYHLDDLVDHLGASHAHLGAVYEDLQIHAFGPVRSMWAAASPAQCDLRIVQRHVDDGFVPRLVVLDQSSEDQLVPMNQVETMEKRLKSLKGLRVVRGMRCTGVHAAPWEQGYMIWENVQDVLELLKKK